MSCSGPGRSDVPSAPAWPGSVWGCGWYRGRPPALAAGVDWQTADATDSAAATDAAHGASVVYQCLNAPYTAWPERFPPLQRAR
jgi:hypothetical protein